MRLNGRSIEPDGHTTDLFTDWAVDYLRERARLKDTRFFLYLAYNAPHLPTERLGERLANVTQRAPQMNRKRAKNVAFVKHLHHALGHVLAARKQSGLEENTAVVFAADNGGPIPRRRPWICG